MVGILGKKNPLFRKKKRMMSDSGFLLFGVGWRSWIGEMACLHDEVERFGADVEVGIKKAFRGFFGDIMAPGSVEINIAVVPSHGLDKVIA